jgi:AmmeMemoRadiSam system protein B
MVRPLALTESHGIILPCRQACIFLSKLNAVCIRISPRSGNEMKNPRLRSDLQLISTMVEGREMLVFIDPMQISDHGLTMNMALLPVLEMLDGTHDLRDIQAEMMRLQGGRLVSISEIEAFVEKLDENYLIDSDNFRQKLRVIYENFEISPDRGPSHAGKSYDQDPEALRRLIQDIENELPPNKEALTGSIIAGILAPHIDVTVAQSTYVNLYRHLKGREYDLIVLLGVNHQRQDGLYSVSEKNYITPFGKLETARDFVSELRERVPAGTLTTSDFGHKLEHSIEFQTIFLDYYLEKPPSIVPILCGSIHDFILQEKNVFDDEHFRGMVSALTDLINARGGNVLLVSGVDFSHVGLKFDDLVPADAILPDARANDDDILSYLLEGDPEKIFENACATKNRFNVCGLPSILIFSSLLRDCNAKLLSHETYHEEATRSAVTYASMIFTKN